MTALRLLGLLSIVALASAACGDDDPPPATSPSNRRGVRTVEPSTPPTPPVEPPAHEFRVPRGRSGRSGAAGAGTPQTPSTTSPDGGLATGDGGRVTDDSPLAAAVEAQGRTLARCFPATLANLPEVAIDFQISVTGIVTRTEVRGEGLDDAVSECLTSAASTIRFPSQASVRAYRYPMRLRRAPSRDGGAAPSGSDGGR